MSLSHVLHRFYPIRTVDPDDVRVTFEHNRSHFIHAVHARLGNPNLQRTYKFDIDFPQLRLACGANSKEVGSLAMAYIVGFLYYLSIYTSHGTDGQNILNFIDVTSQNVIRFAPDLHLTKKSGCRINEHVFEITYDPNHFGELPFDACKGFRDVIEKAKRDKDLRMHPHRAKRAAQDNYEEHWDRKKSDVAMHIQEDLGIENVDLVADFHAIWPKLEDAEGKKPDGDVLRLANDFVDFIHDHFRNLRFEISRFKREPEKMRVIRDTFHDPIPHSPDAAFIPRIRLDVVVGQEAQDVRHVVWENGVLVMKATPSQFTSPEWVTEAAQLCFNRLLA